MRKLLVLAVVALVMVFVIAPRFMQPTGNRAQAAAASAGLRLAVLQRKFIDTTTVEDPDDVQCVVMDWNVGQAVATLVAFEDGTTSVYLSSGGGFIGAGTHESVKQAAARFRAAAAEHADQFAATTDLALPASGNTRFFIITRTKTLATRPQPNGDLTNPSNLLKPVADAAQATISEIRHKS
jgi:hypothetical protein